MYVCNGSTFTTSCRAIDRTRSSRVCRCHASKVVSNRRLCGFGLESTMMPYAWRGLWEERLYIRWCRANGIYMSRGKFHLVVFSRVCLLEVGSRLSLPCWPRLQDVELRREIPPYLPASTALPGSVTVSPYRHCGAEVSDHAI